MDETQEMDISEINRLTYCDLSPGQDGGDENMRHTHTNTLRSRHIVYFRCIYYSV